MTALDKLELLDVRDVAAVLNYTVRNDGRCTQLERITSEKYCSEKGIRPLPYYFGGARMKFDKHEFKEWLQQFKNKKWTIAK
jgi:hypothetical protein